MNLTNVLGNMNKGRFARDLEEALAKVVEESKTHLKKGSLIIQLDVEPTGSEDAMGVTGSIKLKLPASKPSMSLFFATEDHRLVRDNPRQTNLPFENLGGGAGETEQEHEEKPAPVVMEG